jgi:hypothetical protein
MQNDFELLRRYLRREAAVRPQRKNPRDCLLKTQVCANSQEDVYGLTPAQCWKVNERGASFEPKPQ